MDFSRVFCLIVFASFVKCFQYMKSVLWNSDFFICRIS